MQHHALCHKFTEHILDNSGTPVFFYSVLRPFQDYFSSYETGQSVDETKIGEPREKPSGTPAPIFECSRDFPDLQNTIQKRFGIS